eukprot:351265-Chlamydomonas_euryale.AAC.1
MSPPAQATPAAPAVSAQQLADGDGVLADGTTWKKRSGEEFGPNGYWKRWTLLSGASADGSVSWEEVFWEASDHVGFRELGAAKKGVGEDGEAVSFWFRAKPMGVGCWVPRRRASGRTGRRSVVYFGQSRWVLGGGRREKGCRGGQGGALLFILGKADGCWVVGAAKKGVGEDREAVCCLFWAKPMGGGSWASDVCTRIDGGGAHTWYVVASQTPCLPSGRQADGLLDVCGWCSALGVHTCVGGCEHRPGRGVNPCRGVNACGGDCEHRLGCEHLSGPGTQTAGDLGSGGFEQWGKDTHRVYATRSI